MFEAFHNCKKNCKKKQNKKKKNFKTKNKKQKIQYNQQQFFLILQLFSTQGILIVAQNANIYSKPEK